MKTTTNIFDDNDLSELNRGRALIHTAHLIERAWTSFDQARPAQPEVDTLVQDLLAQSLPEAGTDAIAALDEAERILDQSLSQSRPRFFAFVGSSGLEMGVLADALAASHDVNLATYAGAANLVEQQALRWIAELLGYPGQHGSFTSGGMLSNLTALTAARERALPNSRIDGVRGDVAVYVSKEAHSSVARAVEILGIGSRSLRNISITANRQMDVEALRKTIEEDIASGVTPIAIVASAGTTLAGVVDPIAEIGQVAQAHNIWLHIDGAYGIPAAAVSGARHHFAGLDLADSVTVDAHKWLFLPKPCGVLLVKDQAALTAAFTHDASYIPDDPNDLNPVEWTLEYSRPLRALKAWLAFRTYGATNFRRAIQRNLEQAILCAELVVAAPNLSLWQEPTLSVVLFRRVPSSKNVEVGDINAHNRLLAQTLQADGRVYVVSATVDGEEWLRACFVNYRTTENDVRELIQIVEEVGAKIEQS